MKIFYFFLGFGMSNIYLTIFKTIAPFVIQILRDQAGKTDSTIDDKLVTILESILKEFNILGK